MYFVLIEPYQMASEMVMEFPASPTGMTFQSEKLQNRTAFEVV